MNKPEFDIVAATNRLRELDEERNRLRRQIKEFNRYGSYGSTYCKSDHWKSLKEQHCGPDQTCCACGYDAELTLHHMCYKRLYAERTGDLIRLCNRCHQKLHQWLKEKYPGKSINRLIRQTKTDFHKIFGVHWSDEFDVKLPGRRVVTSLSQVKGRRKAKKTLREKKRRHDRHDSRKSLVSGE